MTILAAFVVLLITCMPILIPILIRNGDPLSIFVMENYKRNFKDLMFLIVVTAAVGLLEFVEKMMDGKLKGSNTVELILFGCFLFSLFYALIQVGVYAKTPEASLDELEKRTILIALIVNGANMVAVLGFKGMSA